MLSVLRSTWPLYLGILLLMVGNGMQGTLLGIRGGIEGFATTEMSVVMAGYFAGFLGGSYLAPGMLRRVGHVRVFAALGSLISAILVLYPVLPDWPVWALLRVLIGFCFAGVYVTAESWLNNASANDTRGQALSAYMIVTMLGIVAAQSLVNLADAASFVIFIIPSVLVSLSFTPILLTASPAPSFATTRPMSIRTLYAISPLGCVGMFLTGGMFAAMFGMAAVYGTNAGFSVAQITLFTGAAYVGGLILQYPVGWISDRMDRRQLIIWLSLAGAGALAVGAMLTLPFVVVLGLALVMGGVINPLYSLLIAHANDHLMQDDMAAASSGLVFIHGLGAITGPLITGWLMVTLGPGGFFLYISVLLALLAGYAGWRTTRRAAPSPEDAGAFVPIAPTAAALAVEAMVEGRSTDDPAPTPDRAAAPGTG